MLFDSQEFALLDFRHLRWAASEALRFRCSFFAAYQERGVTFRQGYGLTEVGVNCFAMSDETLSVRLVRLAGQ